MDVPQPYRPNPAYLASSVRLNESKKSFNFSKLTWAKITAFQHIKKRSVIRVLITPLVTSSNLLPMEITIHPYKINKVRNVLSTI